MVIVSAGIRPRDELARQAGLTVGERGGIAVNDRLETSDPRIFAIGECALHGGMIYGLVAPGYEMAEIVAANLTGGDRRFRRRRPVDQAQADGRRRRQLRRLRSCRRSRRRRWCSKTRSPAFTRSCCSRRTARGCSAASWSATRRDYGRLSMLAKSDAPLPCQPHELIVGAASAAAPRSVSTRCPTSAQVCSCNNVTKGAICAADPRRRASTRSTRSSAAPRPAPAAAAACRW